MRLEAGLLDISRRLKIVRQREESLSDPKLLKRCDSLFESASKAKQERRFYVAWDCLQQIERELLATLVEEEELAARWIGFLEEANQKLRRWRKTSVDKIGKSAPPAPKIEVIRAVMEHLHAQSQNQFHKQDLLARYVTALLIAAISVITVILGFAGIGSFDWLQNATDPKGPSVFHLLGAGVLLGLMGSVLSVAFVAVHRDLTDDVPTFSRPVCRDFIAGGTRGGGRIADRIFRSRWLAESRRSEKRNHIGPLFYWRLFGTLVHRQDKDVGRGLAAAWRKKLNRRSI
jgi:hypothetical protein